MKSETKKNEISEPIFIGFAEELNKEQEDKDIEDILKFEMKEGQSVAT